MFQLCILGCFFFPPSQHDKLLQSCTKVTFSSRALHPQQTPNSSLAFANRASAFGLTSGMLYVKGVAATNTPVMNTAFLEKRWQQSFAGGSFSGFYRGVQAFPLPCGLLPKLRVRTNLCQHSEQFCSLHHVPQPS